MILFLLAIGAIAVIGGFAGWALTKFTDITLGLISFILDLVIPAVRYLFELIANLSALIINTFLLLNPFSHLTVAPLLWEFFKNIAYVVLVFLSLYAGFQFILNKEDEARRLLIGILIVAFLINFTFILAKEFFSFFWYLTKAVLQIIGQTSSNNDIYYTDFGNTLYLSMALLIGDKAKEIEERINTQILNINVDDQQLDMMRTFTKFVFNLFLLIMTFIGSIIMAMFAGIALGKFFIISFLAGLLPLACIAYILPNQKRYFDQWWQIFFTWNINILILILLVSIGIFLFASTAGANKIIDDIFMINDIQSKTQPQAGIGGIGIFISVLTPALIYSGRILIIIIYYLIVIILGLRLGGRFSKAGYDFTKWSWTKTGSLIAEGGKLIARRPLYGLGEKLNEIANRWAERGPTWALISKRIRGIGEKMKQPTKERSREAIEEIWKAYQYKGVTDIAQAANRLKGEDLYNFARLISRDKLPDEILQIYNQSDTLKRDVRARKILCQRVRCAFDDLAQGDKATAMQKLGTTLNFIIVSLDDLERLFEIRGEERGELLQFLISNMPQGRKINFFSNPENIRKIGEWGLESILQLEEGTIKKTPHYRVFKEIMDNILRQLIENERERGQILEAYLQRYIRGGVDVMSLTVDRLREELRQIMNNLNIRVDIREVPPEQLNKLISQLKLALQTRPVESASNMGQNERNRKEEEERNNQ